MRKLPFARRQEIIEMLKKADYVDADQLSKQFDVSYMTINRDLQELDEQGIIKRVRGGAHAVNKSLYPHNPVNYDYEGGVKLGKKIAPYFDLSIEERFNLSKEKKQKISEYAASLVDDGDVIGMDPSTTILHMCSFLMNKRITVVTTSLMVALQFASSNTVTVILPAGRLRKRSISIIDSGLDETLNKVHMDKCFISSHALSENEGLMDLTMEESDAKRKLISRSSKVYVLVDNTKIDKTASFNICKPDKMDYLITNSKSTLTSEQVECLKNYEDAGVNIVYTE